MNFFRRALISLCGPCLVLLFGCSTFQPAVDPAVRMLLAPTGELRVGVYLGSPTSLVRDPKTGESSGVALDLGRALGQRLGIPVKVFEFGRLALVLDALKAGQIDFTFTNATEARAQDMDFTRPLLQLELGYLVLSESPYKEISDIDRPSMRVGVTQGSSSQGVLTREFKSARVVPATSLKQAQDMLKEKKIDAFATNKAILFEMSDELSGSRVMDGRWGLENLAIAIPKGRDVARPFLNEFAASAQLNGQLQGAVKRAGLRGTANTR